MSSKIQILFFDIDGTLISQKQPYLSDMLIQTLHHLKEQGILLCIASGRHRSEIEHDLCLNDQFPFDAYITMNGCFCYDADGTVIFEMPIERQDVAAAVQFVQEHDLSCVFTGQNGMFLNQIDDTARQVHASIQAPFPPLQEASSALALDIYQIIPFFESEKVNCMLEAMPDCRATSWHPFAFDIVHKQTGKSRGIEEVMRHYGLHAENAMAFGDGQNDLDMFNAVQYPVAMKNADPSVQRSACYVTGSVEEEGILQALVYFGLAGQEA